MEPILDETSLVPCPELLPGARIEALATTLWELDKIGAPRVLRTTRDAADRDIHEGKGLRTWCFDKATNKDAGRLIAVRLGKQPFVDGEAGLYGIAEDQRVVEAKSAGTTAQGLGLAALTGAFVVALACHTSAAGGCASVELTYLEEDAVERCESVEVIRLVHSAGVVAARTELRAQLDGAVTTGQLLLERASELFPHLVIGPDALAPITALAGTELRQVVRHLRALELGALAWKLETAFEPVAITFSVESIQTLRHGKYGPMRNFTVPAGYSAEQFSLHTKITGGANARLYYRSGRRDDKPKTPYVIVGYLGPHLPTVKYPT